MHKLSVKILTRYNGTTYTKTVQAYDIDGKFCAHRSFDNPKYWKLTSILHGACDGEFYRTRYEAVTRYCEIDWHEKLINAYTKCTLNPADYPSLD